MRAKRYIILLMFILVFSIVSAGCAIEIGSESDDGHDYKDKLIIHFLDVGQGDSTFIQFPNGETSLIDGGSRGYGEKVVDYIDSLGVGEIDYLIATHPHEDHIGGLPDVVRNFKISKVYMPNKIANTRIYEELLQEIDNRGLKINLAKAGDTIIDEGQLSYYILAPFKEDYAKTNDFSISTRIEYINNSIVMTGDAEKSSELEMVEGVTDLKADLLKIGHHGGRTSSNMEFLDRVKPKYSIISVGRDNSYGHPHEETLDRLNKIKSKIMRTDDLGDIVFASDGHGFVHLDEISRQTTGQKKYIGNKNTKVYHSMDCNSLPKKDNQVFFKSIEEAEKNGYRPHDKCIKNGGD